MKHGQTPVAPQLVLLTSSGGQRTSTGAKARASEHGAYGRPHRAPKARSGTDSHAELDQVGTRESRSASGNGCAAHEASQ
eukprot:11288866-Alexandrium_andersonii.AAC.1